MKNFILLSFLMIALGKTYAQDSSLLAMIRDSLPTSEKVSGAFKSTRVINAHSVEMLSKGNLDFRIMHRFGFISDGLKEFFGLDDASMRMSFDYGLSDNVTIGIGRSTFRKELDGFLKTRLVQQTKGLKNIPVSIVLVGGLTIWTEESFAAIKPDLADRTSYYIQLVAGRKFNSIFSFQLSPIWVHSNLPFSGNDEKNIFALGGGARLKFSKSMAFTFDYHHTLNRDNPEYTNPISIGLDIETGGHVFQLQFSNATGMNERAYITETTGHFFEGDIRFGFNLSRMFQLGKKKEW